MSTAQGLKLSVLTPTSQHVWDVVWVNLPAQKGRRGLFAQTAPEIMQIQEGPMIFLPHGTLDSQEHTLGEGWAHIYTHVDGRTWCDIITSECD